MTYGSKLFCLLTILSLLFIVGCEKNIPNFHLDLYDSYSIKAIDNKINLYKNDEIINVEDNYQIKEFKYNSDVVCLKLASGKYYMIYYVDGSIFGPYTKDSLNETIKNDSTMSFESDFQNILKAEVTYDE